MTRTLKKIPPRVSFKLRYLFQDKVVRGKQLLKLYPEYLRTSLYRHAAKSMDSAQVVDKRKFKKGRPKKVSLREERIVLQEYAIKGRIWVICYQEATIGFWTR